MKMPAALDRVSQALNRRVKGLVCIMGMVMALVVALQVVSRYGFNHSLFWSEELARFLLIWLSFLGATVAYCHGVHPGVDSLVRRLPAIPRTVAFYPDGYHMLLRDRQGAVVIWDIAAWIDNQYAGLPSGADRYRMPDRLAAR